jgi:hypothetical protein
MKVLHTTTWVFLSCNDVDGCFSKQCVSNVRGIKPARAQCGHVNDTIVRRGIVSPA